MSTEDSVAIVNAEMQHIAQAKAALIAKYGFKDEAALGKGLRYLTRLRDQERILHSGDVSLDIVGVRDQLSKLKEAAEAASMHIAQFRKQASKLSDTVHGFSAPVSIVERLTPVLVAFDQDEPLELVSVLMESEEDQEGHFEDVQKTLQFWRSLQLLKSGKRTSDNLLLLKALTVCRVYLHHENKQRKKGERGLGWSFKSLDDDAVRASNNAALLKGIAESAVVDLLTASDIPFTFQAIWGAQKRVKLRWPPG